MQISPGILHSGKMIRFTTHIKHVSIRFWSKKDATFVQQEKRVYKHALSLKRREFFAQEDKFVWKYTH